MADPEVIDPTPQNGVNQFCHPSHRLRQKTTKNFLEFEQEGRASLHSRRYSHSPFPPQGFHPAEIKPQVGKTFAALRNHLPPRTAWLQASGLPLRRGLSGIRPPDPQNDTRLPQLPRAPCELPHPQSRTGSDQVSGFALFCTLAHPRRRIRFDCAMCSSLPIASFRPCRCQQRPCDSDCLPPGRGDACFLQQAGFARYAGQTKKRAGYKPGPLNG